jgi:hypothetical protein
VAASASGVYVVSWAVSDHRIAHDMHDNDLNRFWENRSPQDFAGFQLVQIHLPARLG